jgi:hypothetical protein
LKYYKDKSSGASILRELGKAGEHYALALVAAIIGRASSSTSSTSTPAEYVTGQAGEK